MTLELNILLAVKDGEQYLSQTLDTLLNQSYPHFEFVIVDDGSTDKTPAILEGYAARDPRLIIIRNERNMGVPGALNRGLEECKAPLIAKSDADDLHRPERLVRQLAFMKGNPAVGVLGTGFNRMTPAGEIMKAVVPPTDHDTIYARQNFINSFLHSSIMYRTDLIRSVGGYDAAYPTAQDTDLWVRLRDRTCFANLPEVLVDYRVHPRSIMGTRGEKGRFKGLTVPQRLLSGLLGRQLDDVDVSAIVELYQGFRTMSVDDVRRAAPLLRECLRALSRYTPPRAMKYLRREAASSCLKQMEAHLWSDRGLARELLAVAASFDARTALRRSSTRALLPRRRA